VSFHVFIAAKIAAQAHDCQKPADIGAFFFPNSEGVCLTVSLIADGFATFENKNAPHANQHMRGVLNEGTFKSR
jgi:hypothetical protein